MLLSYTYLLLLIKYSNSYFFTVDSRYNDTKECLTSEGTVPCNSLEYIASNTDEKYDISIKITSPNIYMHGEASFYNITEIKIAGHDQTTINVLCALAHKDGPASIGSSLVFNQTKKITLSRLNFTKCTGESKIYEITYLYSVLIINSTCINISQLFVSNSTGYGLILINAQSEVSIMESGFLFNSNKDMSFEFHSGGMLILNKQNQISASYNISNVKFIRNEANSSNITEQNRGQGGGLHIRCVDSKNSVILLHQVLFQENAGYYGGGLFIFYQQKSSNNTIKVHQCSFTENTAYKGGAGCNIGFKKSEKNKETSFSNSVFFLQCEWINNNAKRHGGGVAIFATLLNMQDYTTVVNQVVIQHSKFIYNNSTRGAAIFLAPTLLRTSGSTFFLRVEIQRCSFNENYAFDQLQKDFPVGAIVVSTIFQLTLTDRNHFTSNFGTALLLSSTTVIFVNSTNTFHNNTAESGGAIRLTRKSYIELIGENTLNFTTNTALRGGAIIATQLNQYNYEYMDTCFLKGDGQHSKFFFQNNTAITTFGGDMFINTLLPCLRHTECKTVPELFEKNCICHFIFSNKSISTVAYMLKADSKILNPVPGREMHFEVEQLDQLGNKMDYFMLWLRIFSTTETSIKLKSSSQTASNGSIIIVGNPNTAADLIVESIKKSTQPITLKVVMGYCYPGFIFDKKIKECNCSYQSKETMYLGINHCISNEFAVLSVGYWAGYLRGNGSSNYNKNETFVTSKCPAILCSFNSSKLHLSGMRMSYDAKQLERDICRENRCGVLCSKCCDNTSVYYNSPKHSCKTTKECEKGLGFMYFLLQEIVPTTCLFLAILFFNINLTSGSVYTMVFFVQSLDSFSVNLAGHLKIDKNIINMLEVYKILYGISNMRFFTLEPLSFCIWKGANIYDVITLKYVVTGYAILLVLGTIALLKAYSLYMCIKVCKKCGRKNIRYSVVHSLSAFLLICYYHIVHNTLVILRCSEIRTAGNKLVKKVASFDGEISCYSKEHFKYMVLPLISLVLIAFPPLVLVLEPIIMKLSDKMKIKRQFTLLSRLRLLLKPFLDSFQGCFKNNCRIFAGLFFVYRLILGEWFITATNSYIQMSYVLATIIIIIIVHIIFRPFATPWHNKLDVFLLVNLLLIILLSYINVTNNDCTIQPSSETKFILIAQLLLMSAPFVYIGVYTVNLIRKYINNFICAKALENKFLTASQEDAFAKLERKHFYRSSFLELTEKN